MEEDNHRERVWMNFSGCLACLLLLVLILAGLAAIKFLLNYLSSGVF